MNKLMEKRWQQSRSVFSRLEPLTLRSQFGGYGILSDGVMFAILSDNELYLRGHRLNSELYLIEGMKPFHYTKRGIPVRLAYYSVHSELWLQPEKLFMLAEQSVFYAKKDRDERAKASMKLRDLPNITSSTERILWRSGICSVDKLYELGAKRAYLHLKAYKQSVPDTVIYTLAGAIRGDHVSVLPTELREALDHWVSNEAHKEIKKGDDKG